MTYSEDKDSDYKVEQNEDGSYSWDYLGRVSVESFPSESDANLDFIDTTVKEIDQRRNYSEEE